MRIVLVDNGSKYINNLSKFLTSLGQLKVVTDIHKLAAEDFDILVLSGGHHDYITENPNAYLEEIQFISKTKKPIIGICLGAEVVAYTYGATLVKNDIYQKGLTNIKVISDSHIFNNKKSFYVYENHIVAIKELSTNLIGLATSENGYEVVKHKNKPVYCLQFHPEMFEDKTYGDEILKNIIKEFDKRI